jgi:uncharacterized OB-fold protein
MPSPQYRREMPQRYRLEAGRCTTCSKIFFPPRLICSGCGSQDFEKIPLSAQGKIITFTTIRVAPAQFAAEVPYNIAIVELDGGVRLTTQVVDCKPEDMGIDKKVKLVFRKLHPEGKTGIIRYGYKAVLV